MDKRIVGIGIALLIAGIIGAALYFDSDSLNLPTLGGSATSTPKDFTELPEQEIPEGATIIDDYFYTLNGAVYLNSIQGTSSIKIPDAKGSSFKRLSDFTSLSDPNIALSCGKAGEFAYYGDSKNLFFYQLWVTQHFKHSQVEAVLGASPEGLTITGPATFTAEPGNYVIDYETATSTCQYILKREVRD